MTTKRRYRPAILAVGLLICAGTPRSVSARSEPPAPDASPPPATSTDEGGQKPATVVAPATVQAFFVTDLYAKDSGYVSRLDADIGDHVKAGQVLAVIADPELQAQSDRARAAVLQAGAALEVAKRQLASTQADRALQQVTLKRQKELFAGKAATAQALDDQQAKDTVSGANVLVAQAKIASSQADLQAANADAEKFQALLQYDKIAAPFDGVVTRRLVNPGDLVQAATATRTTPLFTVQKLDVVRVFADVPESSAAAIRPGLPAEVKLYGTAGQSFQGAVTRVASAMDPATRTMRVEIDLPNPHESLLPGMYAQVTVTLKPASKLADLPE